MSAAIQRQIALIAATVILIAAIVGIAVDAGEDDTAVVSVPTTTPIPTDEAEEAPTPAATKAPATRAQATQVPAPAKTAAPSTPKRVGPSADATPPKVGVYTYEETTNGETSDSTLRISDAGSGRQEEETDDGRQEVHWRDDGKYILSAEFQGLECDFDPDLLEIKLPLKTGSSWTFDGKCEPFQGVVVTFKGSSKVTGTEKRDVGGTTVDTWVIESEGSFEGSSPQGSFEMDVTGSERFDPEHGLYVYSKSTSEGTDPSTGETGKESTTSRLKSLNPQ